MGERGRSDDSGYASPIPAVKRIKARRFGEQYWLYVVVNCKGKPELHLVQNPASKPVPREAVSAVRYAVVPDFPGTHRRAGERQTGLPTRSRFGFVVLRTI